MTEWFEVQNMVGDIKEVMVAVNYEFNTQDNKEEVDECLVLTRYHLEKAIDVLNEAEALLPHYDYL